MKVHPFRRVGRQTIEKALTMYVEPSRFLPRPAGLARIESWHH
jgi:hypothetical protein